MSHVLIVDDSTDLLELFTVIFQVHNIDCTSSTSHTMFELLKDTMPHLIIIDVILKGKDGRKICKQIKTTPELMHIPVIIMSTDHHQLADHTNCLADDTLEMPFKIDILLSKVKAQLNK